MNKAFANICLRLTFLLVSSSQAASFSEQDLVQILKENSETKLPVQSIAELIPLLPKELRKNFTFVYKSRSPFEESISPLFPRVVLFSDDARQVLTFTGDPTKPGYDYLEMMTFSDATSEFKFSIHTLPNALKSFRALNSQDTNCTRCHGQDPRPIYDSYPLWPGFYGSIQDTFPQQSIVGRNEQKNYVQFLQTNAKRGVYKDLIYPKGSPVSPYLNPENFTPEKKVGNLDDFRFFPNTRLGMALTELNRKRIYRKLSQNSVFRKKQSEFLAELLNCSASKRRNFQTENIKVFLQKENRERLIRLGSDPDDPNERINDMQELDFATELEQLDWVAKSSGVDREDWSMALEANSLSFFDGILSGVHKGKSYYVKEDLIFEILQNLAKTNPKKMKKYFHINPVYSWLSFPFGNRINLTQALKFCDAIK